eukprot:293517-Amorphochlora_amoeboformis.AAC.1
MELLRDRFKSTRDRWRSNFIEYPIALNSTGWYPVIPECDDIDTCVSIISSERQSKRIQAV